MNNCAIIVKLANVRPIEGADKIVLADVMLNGIKQTQVIVSKDTNTTIPYVYFDSNLSLSEELLKQDETLKRYLAKGNRVRVIKLKGVISNGLIISEGLFYKFFNSDIDFVDFMQEGKEFTEINGVEICKKYIPAVKQQSISGKKKPKKGKVTSRIIEGQFNFHFDTAQLLKNIHRIQPTDIVSISEKWHGTSCIASNSLVKKSLNWYEQLIKKLGVNIVDTTYDLIVSSRKVIKNGNLDTSSYYPDDIWGLASKVFESKLYKGESIYFEIVGHLPSGGWIQRGYDYGCNPGEHQIRVYRITKIGPDGNVVEYSVPQMIERCKELEVKPVEQIYYGQAIDLFKDIAAEVDWQKAFLQKLQENYIGGNCKWCKNKVPAEGIVLRVEGLNIESYKLKSEEFYLKESTIKETEDDIEDAN